jgi:2-polyprenyl-3-methyl-5-hydroxy-6-metoxy-1,4-benzoquinol methylase
MKIDIKRRDINIEERIKELAPWGHYFKFDESTITGFYKQIASDDEVITTPEKTFCTKYDSKEKIAQFKNAYEDLIVRSKRQFMLINILKKIMGSDFLESEVYDFGCNDGMKTFYFKQAGVKKITGFEYRKECIDRANFINEVSGLNCNFVHHEISADAKEYTKGLEPVDIVASFGILHHVVNHENHIKSLKKVTKRVLVMHAAFSATEMLLDEKNLNNSFKSVMGKRKMVNKLDVFNMLYDAGFSYVLDVRDHKSIDEKGFASYLTYLIAVV